MKRQHRLQNPQFIRNYLPAGGAGQGTRIPHSNPHLTQQAPPVARGNYLESRERRAPIRPTCIQRPRRRRRRTPDRTARGPGSGTARRRLTPDAEAAPQRRELSG